MTYKYLYKITIVFVLTVFGSLSMKGQDCGSSVVSEATQYYDIGQFDKVISELKGCLSGGFKESSQQVDGLRILSMTYIALDSIHYAEKYVADLLELDPTFQARSVDPVVFQALIFKGKLGQLGLNVSSVSKVSESFYEAPATVLLVTEEEIKQRGYTDLEQLLRDLPGFDISQSNGITYSSIYQRGYRSINTDRMLLLVDGVEDNDLWGNIVYLSRQYSMSNISSVEVIYGPSSTIYGPNAFVGVISINTKNPIEYLDDNDNFGFAIETGYGQWRDRYVDATFATRIPDHPVELSLTGRVFLSDEPNNLNGDWFDYQIPDFSQLMRDSLDRLLGIVNDTAAAQAFLTSASGKNPSFYESIIENGDITGIRLTDAGVREALARDKDLLSNSAYSDNTEAYSLSGKLKIYDLTIGFQYWQKKEGLGSWYNDVRQGTAKQGQSWNPTSTMFYLKYNKEVSSKLSLKSFTRYKVHGYLKDNALVTLNSFSNGRLTLLDLVNDSTATWDTSYLSVRSNQVRSEFTAIYRFSPNWNFFTGVEMRFSVIQADYITGEDENPEENATAPVLEGGNHFFSRDVGVYAQTNYLVSDIFKITAGLRYDNNRTRLTEGYGGQFNPRFAIIYQPRKWVFKGIYARAFKAPTNSNLYSTVAGQRELNNPGLKPETVDNIEISVRRFFTETFHIEAVAYRARYNRTLQEVVVPYQGGFTNQFKSTGELLVKGGHLVATYQKKNLSLYFNYTYTDPSNLIGAPKDSTQKIEVRVSDIASHQCNIGGNYIYKGFNFNLRSNIIGRKITGKETSVPGNLDDFPAYAIFNGALSYHLKRFNLHFDFMVNNILNKQYYSPGVRAADNTRFSSSLPQKGRNLHVRLRFRL
ncbi:MAG: TonB-dependent receptor plug domain-containing protein [Saprospiraceae bacterium]